MRQRMDELACNTMWRNYETSALVNNKDEMNFILTRDWAASKYVARP